ncbi:MAG: HAMP domain-containing histidine kinase [Magnetococcales bacterium]|nr:HAMP domain-containing histidine kinase [Magnetococcales bacterium]
MSELSDDALIAELKSRFDTTKQALEEVKIITKKLEEMNRKLRASEQIKSTFISLVKNEINNPLTSILGLSEQLRLGEHPQETVVSIADMIHQESFTLDFQLRNIFITAELESGEADIQISSVDVTALINDVIDSFSHLLKEKLIKHRVETPGRIIFNTDSSHLNIIVANLLANAIKFNLDGGDIIVKASVANDTLNLSVEDSGIGIDKTRVGRLFDRFYQSDAGIMKRHKGHGLGLAIIKALIESMEGTINAETLKSGGSIFSISLPQKQIDAETASFEVEGGVLLFDDDETVEEF